MGFLTNPSSQDKFPRIFVQYHKKLCWLSYAAGIVWFFLLAFKPIGLNTYFSENALLPGLVRLEFEGHLDAKHYLDVLKEEAERYHSGMPVPWLLAAFKQLGLDAYVHPFVIHKPMTNSNFTGSNVYAILRAPRSIGTEALLMSTPYRSEQAFLPNTLPSVALMLSLAKYFRKHTYWAKDIIFLISEHEQIGMQAWVEAYHQSPISKGVLESDDLPGRSGSIQAALNLEIPSEDVNTFDLKIEGLNGQLPNLDFFNTATHLCKKEGFTVTFKGRKDFSRKNDYLDWQYSLKTLMAMMKSQATGIPSGNHGLLHRFHIEALTLEGKKSPKLKSYNGFLRMGLVVEGIFRSLNNLLERFHQSYFFYLLPSTSRFVSIGMYMPPFSLLALGILIKALALRFETTILAEKQAETIAEHASIDENGDETAARKLYFTVNYSFASLLPVIILTHTVGLLLNVSPSYFNQIGSYWNLKMEASVFSGIIALFFTMLVLPKFITMRDSSGVANSWMVLKCLSLLELGMLLFAVAFINFSLACIVTLIYAPICVGVSPSKKKFAQWIKGLPVLLASPLFLVFLFVAYDTIGVHSDISPSSLLEKCFFTTRYTIMYSIMDTYIYGNWLFDVGTLLLTPIWLQFWIITQLKI